jgi:phospholipid/cholesterol/gamma-HCH transport system permease protein
MGRLLLQYWNDARYGASDFRSYGCKFIKLLGFSQTNGWVYPFVIGISMFLGILGGWVAAVYGGFGASDEVIGGVQQDCIPFHIAYAFIKTFVFALLLATIPSFHGYYMKGGALEVGKASTVSFVWTSVMIIAMNYILTQMLLTQ